ncbi:hypothetical protein QQF64_025813 [Cirrhinus molitorella]|uniref:Retrotransposon gag domain-containing protein n=1 Tax=Cirrhinus molitorella TaxID=172907 RepID=A0ABR3NQI5_9TELE
MKEEEQGGLMKMKEERQDLNEVEEKHQVQKDHNVNGEKSYPTPIHHPRLSSAVGQSSGSAGLEPWTFRYCNSSLASCATKTYSPTSVSHLSLHPNSVQQPSSQVSGALCFHTTRWLCFIPAGTYATVQIHLHLCITASLAWLSPNSWKRNSSFDSASTRLSDEADPLLYLIRCQGFLALHPLADIDILATFRSILHGTARDWWEVTRSSITTWTEFETAFLSAFLSEDHEDELAERVRTRHQRERESIRDFVFTYHALCKRWKPCLTENETVKMILKNINPYLASQLRSHVNTVGELVKLEHQIEKDHEQQLQYEKSMSRKSQPDRCSSDGVSLPSTSLKRDFVVCFSSKKIGEDLLRFQEVMPHHLSAGDHAEQYAN